MEKIIKIFSTSFLNILWTTGMLSFLATILFILTLY